MAEKKITTLFDKANYLWMIIGGLVMILGLILMAGGKSSDPSQFLAKEIYSPMRVTVAPILFFGGLMIEIYGIMKKRKS